MSLTIVSIRISIAIGDGTETQSITACSKTEVLFRLLDCTLVVKSPAFTRAIMHSKQYGGIPVPVSPKLIDVSRPFVHVAGVSESGVISLKDFDYVPVQGWQFFPKRIFPLGFFPVFTVPEEIGFIHFWTKPEKKPFIN